jgi:hypothetical protein
MSERANDPRSDTDTESSIRETRIGASQMGRGRRCGALVGASKAMAVARDRSVVAMSDVRPRTADVSSHRGRAPHRPSSSGISARLAGKSLHKTSWLRRDTDAGRASRPPRSLDWVVD